MPRTSQHWIAEIKNLSINKMSIFNSTLIVTAMLIDTQWNCKVCTYWCSRRTFSTWFVLLFHTNKAPSCEPAITYCPSGLNTALDQSQPTWNPSALQMGMFKFTTIKRQWWRVLPLISLCNFWPIIILSPIIIRFVLPRSRHPLFNNITVLTSGYQRLDSFVNLLIWLNHLWNNSVKLLYLQYEFNSVPMRPFTPALHWKSRTLILETNLQLNLML